MGKMCSAITGNRQDTVVGYDDASFNIRFLCIAHLSTLYCLLQKCCCVSRMCCSLY